MSLHMFEPDYASDNQILTPGGPTPKDLIQYIDLKFYSCLWITLTCSSAEVEAKRGRSLTQQK